MGGVLVGLVRIVAWRVRKVGAIVSLRLVALALVLTLGTIRVFGTVVTGKAAIG